MVFPIVVPPAPRDHDLYIISESFHVNMSSSRTVVLEKKILKLSNPIFVFL
jgi:hypothetical protein